MESVIIKGRNSYYINPFTKFLANIFNLVNNSLKTESNEFEEEKAEIALNNETSTQIAFRNNDSGIRIRLILLDDEENTQQNEEYVDESYQNDTSYNSSCKLFLLAFDTNYIIAERRKKTIRSMESSSLEEEDSD